MAEVIFRGGTLLTMDDNFSIRTGDLVCRDGLLVQVGGHYTPKTADYSIIDAEDTIVMPGLVQSHIHMCQTLARGRADGRELLDWLHDIVWPYEGTLTRDDVSASAQLSCLELLSGGTTAILDMGTVHHSDALFEAARDSGLRATIGKAMMDETDPAIPPSLRETTTNSLDESQRLYRDWHGRNNNRLRYAYTPRFALSCTDDLIEECVRLARQHDTRLHTHSSENQHEIAEIKKRKGMDPIAYLHKLGMSGSDVCLAHCVWISEAEQSILRDTGTHVLHCPSSNMKLASGFARIPDFLADGISVSLGADGAPCNNNLDGFMEMRFASLVHKPRNGAKAMPAADVVKLATLGGAKALGLEDNIGSLEVGKQADVITVNINQSHCIPAHDPYSTLVYSSRASDVNDVVIDGKIVIRKREILTMDHEFTLRNAQQRANALFARL